MLTELPLKYHWVQTEERDLYRTKQRSDKEGLSSDTLPFLLSPNYKEKACPRWLVWFLSLSQLISSWRKTPKMDGQERGNSALSQTGAMKARIASAWSGAEETERGTETKRFKNEKLGRIKHGHLNKKGDTSSKLTSFLGCLRCQWLFTFSNSTICTVY